jgi:hypothetical protein
MAESRRGGDAAGARSGVTVVAVQAALDALPVACEWASGVIQATQTPRLLGTLPARVGIVELRGADELIGVTYLGVVSPNLLTAAALNGQVLAVLLATILPGWPTSERWLADVLRTAATTPAETEVTHRRHGWDLTLTVRPRQSLVRLEARAV